MTEEEIDDWRWAKAQEWAPEAKVHEWPPMELVEPGLVFIYRSLVRAGVTPENYEEPDAG